MSQQLRSYAASGGFFNSTVPAITLPDTFAPSVVSVIAVVAWYGSLMITLIAASYAMLVKQWLREYLALDSSSSLARLRVRCFRYPALVMWKVFEIVAILPLLLQLALDLFFLGLCFFASEIHPAVKWTVYTLVIIWAVLFLVATLAPVLSAHYPYKKTLLKSTMKRLRSYAVVVHNVSD